jgi:hypothetical protein
MKPLGLGEHGGLTIVREGRAFVAYLRYRDYSGRGRRIKRSGRSRAEASREVLRAVKQALGADGDDQFTARNTLNEAAKGWLAMFAGQVEPGCALAVDLRRIPRCDQTGHRTRCGIAPPR